MRKVDELRKRAANLKHREVSAKLPRSHSAQGGQSYINRDMTDDRRVVGEPYVIRIVLVVEIEVIRALSGGRRRLIIDDERALNIDLDGTWMRDCILHLSSR